MTHTASPRSASRLRVLVVEDVSDSRRTLCLLVRSWGHAVFQAADGLTALRAAACFSPHVVLLDIGLPGIDGWLVADELRRTTGLAEAVVVGVTGYGADEYRRRSREVGFDAHLVKPVEPEELGRLLGRSAAAIAGAADAVDEAIRIAALKKRLNEEWWAGPGAGPG
jgi:CheY-like chemotaxis protein